MKPRRKRKPQITYEYLWCCYAIAWGINVYDETKKQRTVL